MSLLFIFLALCPFGRVSAFAIAPKQYATSLFSSSSAVTSSRMALAASSEESMKVLTETLLGMSDFVYSYATIRRVVNDHDRLIRDGIPKTKKKYLFFGEELPMVDMYRPELVVTQRGGQETMEEQFLKYPITAIAIKEFLENNRNFLAQNSATGGDVTFNISDKQSSELPPLYEEQRMAEVARLYDGELIDFDDELTSNGGLVYGVTINRSLKRIVVVFRGTVTATLEDGWTDIQFCLTQPDVFKDSGLDINIHKGFSNYLFGYNAKKGSSAFDRIVGFLKKYFKESIPENEHDEYEIYVTGHSLGGALCNLFSFTLAATQDDEYFKQVKAVSFAAPVVGRMEYYREHERLEKDNKLKHIRVSNQNDIVSSIPFPIMPIPGYQQNGVNLHLFESEENKSMEINVGDNNQKFFIPQFSLNFVDIHLPPEYKKRVSSNIALNQDIFSKTMSELYAEVLPLEE